MAEDDAVGYGRPPQHTRFKKGQSGNPKGRPKGVKNFGTVLKAELDQRVSVRDGDGIKRISKRHAVVMSAIAKALKGDIRACILVMQAEEAALKEPLTSDSGALDQAEREILESFGVRRARSNEDSEGIK